jgi:predicted regulator of Ras-like GTPase activity (Roadblock/LC7/MglB family)
MESISDTALLDVLQQLPSLCPEFAGAVVATGDGLVLAAVGEYQGDTPAACAASLFVHLKDDLQPLQGPGTVFSPSELLVFGDDALWHLSRLTAGHLLLLCSRPTPHVGAVRLAGQTTAARLNRWLAKA